MNYLDKPHPTETINSPLGGVIPPERIIIDHFSGERFSRHWYITDDKSLIEVKNRKEVGFLRDDELFSPGIYALNGEIRAYLI